VWGRRKLADWVPAEKRGGGKKGVGSKKPIYGSTAQFLDGERKRASCKDGDTLGKRSSNKDEKRKSFQECGTRALL